MAIKEKTITFDLDEGNDPVRVHRAVAGKFSVEAIDPVVGIELGKGRNGPFTETNFLALTLGQTIPTGAIFARRVVNPADPIRADVKFEIRTRGDFKAQP